jgi:bifunctional UDP-N-acetylglucosamine pyrophosphorylase/glucosamine-1-phosphate N-acetyltransferase
MTNNNLYDFIKPNPLLYELFQTDSWWDDYKKYIDLQSNIKEITRGIIDDTYIDKSAEIEDNVTIKGPVIILEDCEILSGSYIRGPTIIGSDCGIGPNCLINSYCVLGNGVDVGQGAELRCSIIMDGCKIYHFSYIGHSILGRNVNVGAGVITAVRRFDNSLINIRHKGNEISSQRSKFGAIIGNDTQIGIGVKILEGRVIKPNSKVYPGSLVKNNII